MSDSAPPAEVLADSGLVGIRPLPLEGGEGRSWRAGDAVLKPVVSTTDSEHVAELFTSLSPTRVVRVPRPVRPPKAGGYRTAGRRGHGCWVISDPASARSAYQKVLARVTSGAAVALREQRRELHLRHPAAHTASRR